MYTQVSVSLLCTFLATASVEAQTVWHVDDDCIPPAKGTEIDPFCTVQQGIIAASDGDTVLVGPGTYTGNGNRDLNMFGKTITLKSAQGPGLTVMNIEGSTSSIHRGFFLNHGETQQTIIEGLTIINAYLIGNTGGTGPGGGGGGAIYIRDSSPTIRNCIIRENISATLNLPYTVDGRGAGIYIDGTSSAIIEDCILANNVADKRGGGFYIGYNSSSVTVRNCLITGNSASNGGGIYNTFSGTSITNTTIAYNSVVYSGGGIHNEHGEPVLSNCTLWGNSTEDSGPQIFVQGSVVTIEYSVVQGGLEAVGACCAPQIDWGPGMIDADPLFVDEFGGDFRLLPGSPCIDAGNNMAVPQGVVTDLNGLPRFVDDPDTEDCHQDPGQCGDCPVVDMGAYEYEDGTTECCPADFDNDGHINAADLAQLLGTWGPCEGCAADLNGDNVVNAADLAQVLGAWGSCP